MGMFNGPVKVAFGFGLGVAAAGIVKEILPAFRGLGKPLLKATVKSGLILAREGSVKIAEFKETLSDVAAEAEAELRQEEPQFQTAPPFTPEPKAKAEMEIM
jgi:hypothetical protein